MDRLLQVKLAVPRPSQRMISRPRLIALLDGTLGARLLLLSAPPGFGKTSALVDWLAVSGMYIEWWARPSKKPPSRRVVRTDSTQPVAARQRFHASIGPSSRLPGPM